MKPYSHWISCNYRQSNVNSVVRSYLSPTPVGVGVGLYGQLTRLSLPARVWLRHGRKEHVSTASNVLQAGPRKAAGTKQWSCVPPIEPAVSAAEYQLSATKGTVYTIDTLIKAPLKNNYMYDPQRRLVWSAKNYFVPLGAPCLERRL